MSKRQAARILAVWFEEARARAKKIETTFVRGSTAEYHRAARLARMLLTLNGSTR